MVLQIASMSVSLCHRETGEMVPLFFVDGMVLVQRMNAVDCSEQALRAS
jgi:hypothetical protein